MTPLLNHLPVPLALAEVRHLCSTGAARAIREDCDLSLRELAAHLDVSIATLSCWERDAQRPTGDRALRYRQLLLELASRPTYVVAHAGTSHRPRIRA